MTCQKKVDSTRIEHNLASDHHQTFLTKLEYVPFLAMFGGEALIFRHQLVELLKDAVGTSYQMVQLLLFGYACLFEQ